MYRLLPTTLWSPTEFPVSLNCAVVATCSIVDISLPSFSCGIVADPPNRLAKFLAADGILMSYKLNIILFISE
jgi:hypothetical protein